MKALLGLIVNPIAGMGGAVGLHGTDGSTLLEEARRRGAEPVTSTRTVRALRRLDDSAIRVITVVGLMGGDVAASCGIEYELIALVPNEVTTGRDTEAVAEALVASGCELILFAGGDGTAHDVVRGAGHAVPVLGIPSGVKMRSGVFAVSPEAAGEIASNYLTSSDRVVHRADLVDLDEDGSSERLLGVAKVPDSFDGRLVNSKSSAVVGSRAEVEALCRSVAQELDEDTLYLFGPGSTTNEVLSDIGLDGSTLGVDAVVNKRFVGNDLSESEILDLVKEYPKRRLVLGVVGGQGFLLGRGNQQLSAGVLEHFSDDDVLIISSASKLVALNPPVLWVDLDVESTPRICGYHRVRVAPRRSMLMRVSNSA